MNSKLVEIKDLAKEEIAGGVKPQNKCSPKMTTSPAAGEGSVSSPAARQEIQAEMSQDSS